MSSGFDAVDIETVQAYWDRRPCNVRHSPEPIGSRQYFDQVQRRRYFVEPHIAAFADFAKWNGARVLEIGCGIGVDTMQFARAGARVTAVDLSSESLSLARQQAGVYGFEDRVTFIQANCEELSRSVPLDAYDLVYSFGVIHHTPHPQRAVAEMKKYMSAEAELRLMVYSRISYKLFWIMHEENVWDMGRMDELVARNSEAQTGCPVTYTYTFDEVRELLSGFDIFMMDKAHIFTWDIEAYRRHEYKKDPAWAGVTDQQLASWAKELGWHTLVHARLRS